MTTLPNQLLTARNHAGADTPTGRGLSNLNECILARPNYIPQSWATHPDQVPAGKLEWQAKRLESLSLPKGNRA